MFSQKLKGLFRSGLLRLDQLRFKLLHSGLLRPGLLRTTCIAGIILLFLSGGSLVFFSIMGRGSSRVEPMGSFYRSLREFDRQFNDIIRETGTAAGYSAERQNLDLLKAGGLSKELDRMEKNASGVDSLLSVLKRRRRLAQAFPSYLPVYRESARRASASYPNSDSLAAVAAAALVQSSAITGETEAALRTAMPLLSNQRLETLRLCIHVLLGDMQNPQRALANLPRSLSSASIPYSFSGREAIVADMALIKLLRAESAAGEIQELLTWNSERSLNLAAEYFYDFGDPRRSAELFSRIPGENALMRQADALWLAGLSTNARNIWTILTASADNNYRMRSLYNLALSTENPAEAAGLLRTLIQLPPTDNNLYPQQGQRPKFPEYREFGIVHYSRFLEAPQAAALLEGAASLKNPLVDLELLKRRTEMWAPGRNIGASWQLIEQYSGEENLYQWAAWYFDYQRAYSETVMLLKAGARQLYQGQWMSLHEALSCIGEGNIDSAEQILLTLVSVEEPGWEAPANLGRIYEARNAPAQALEYYEKAAALVPGKENASRIQLRIAQCLKNLNRPLESRRVLEYALDLNPGNLSARLELSRLVRD